MLRITMPSTLDVREFCADFGIHTSDKAPTYPENFKTLPHREVVKKLAYIWQFDAYFHPDE